MRFYWMILPLVVLAACDPGVSNPNAGVGFSDYRSYIAEREAALQGHRPAPQPVLPPGAAPRSAATPQAVRSEPIAATPLDVTTPATGQPMSAIAPTALAVPNTGGQTGISDENSFEAVAARQTIQSDAQRIAANRATYQQIPPSSLPQRGAGTTPNLAAYALSAQNRLGEPFWNRGGLKLARHDRACAKYPSPDLAQIAFLKRGGPERDPGNLDPDGDGFACAWNPTPFQAARN